MMSVSKTSIGMEYGNENELAATFDEMFEQLVDVSFDGEWTGSCTGCCGTFNCTAVCPTEGECI